MNKRSVAFLSILAIFMFQATSIFGEDHQSRGVAMFSAVGFEIGTGIGFDLDAGTERVARSFGIAFRLADEVQFGFQGTVTDDAEDLQRYGGMRGEIFFSERIALGVLIGAFLSDAANDPTLATGIGLRYVLASSRGNESFTTGVSLGVDYLLNPGVSVGDGTLLLGLIFSLGI